MSNVNLIGILGLAAIAACWALGVVLFRVSTAGSVGRKLSVLLVIEGFVLASAGFPEFALSIPESIFDSHPVLNITLTLVHLLGDVAMIALYPPFLALALNSNLTRPFGRTPVRIGLAIAAGVLVLAVLLTFSPIVKTLLYLAVTLVFVYALVVSIHAWRTARSGMARKRAGIFALAFGLRDLGWCMSYGIFAWYMWTQPDMVYATMPGLGWVGKIVYALGTLLSVPLIAYGVLRTQLFDIDLKIRWTIKQSAFGFAIVAIIYVLSEGAEFLLSEQFGTVGGLVGAVIVVILLQPLKRFADRVASAAMPNTKNTAKYASERKLQVYESAFAEALYEGGISAKERILLSHLRDSLGVSESDAAAIEGELQALPGS